VLKWEKLKFMYSIEKTLKVGVLRSIFPILYFTWAFT